MNTNDILPDLTAAVEAEQPESKRPKLNYRCVDDVEPVEMKWLWPGTVSSGKLTLFAGDPGLGKSFVTIDMASRVSRGKDWPDGSENQPAGSVIFLACEDDVADTSGLGLSGQMPIWPTSTSLTECQSVTESLVSLLITICLFLKT